MLKYLSTLSVLSCATASLLHTAPSFAQAPQTLQIRQATYNGSGCPRDSGSLRFTAGRSGISLNLDEFKVEYGLGVPRSRSRRNCILSVVVEPTSGWQFASRGLRAWGDIALDRGLRAEVTVSSSFSGQPQTGIFSRTYQGPSQGSVFLAHAPALRDEVWSPCTTSRALNLNFAVRIAPSGAAATGSRGTVSVDRLGWLNTNAATLLVRPC